MEHAFVLLLLPAALLLAGCSAPAEQAANDPQEPAEPQSDLEMLQGKWKPVSMKQDGEFLAKERIDKTRLTIEGENFTFETANDSHGGLYKIAPEKDPKELDIVITRGDEEGKVYLVIYKFEDGQMVQCMEVSNENRPSEFTGEKGSGNLLEYWERVE
ncbi:MAG: TIGR03067 domain-containing protein [Planctomycetota bacterium]|nr:MAG: TIGR03067 domain-containing protein [Planctomycetota bacterium]